MCSPLTAGAHWLSGVQAEAAHWPQTTPARDTGLAQREKPGHEESTQGLKSSPESTRPWGLHPQAGLRPLPTPPPLTPRACRSDGPRGAATGTQGPPAKTGRLTSPRPLRKSLTSHQPAAGGPVGLFSRQGVWTCDPGSLLQAAPLGPLLWLEASPHLLPSPPLLSPLLLAVSHLGSS